MIPFIFPDIPLQHGMEPATDGSKVTHPKNIYMCKNTTVYGIFWYNCCVTHIEIDGKDADFIDSVWQIARIMGFKKSLWKPGNVSGFDPLSEV